MRFAVVAGLAGFTFAAGALLAGEKVVPGVDVVSLANEGVYLEGGGRAVMIDGCVREPYLQYGAVPDEAWAKLLEVAAAIEAAGRAGARSLRA